MEDIRKFIRIMEGTIDQTFDNDNIDKHDKVLQRLDKDFNDMFKDRKKKKVDDKDKKDVKEGPISKALKIGAFGVLLNLTGGVSANERDVMGTSIQAVQQMQNIPDSKRKDIIKRELIKSAQASIGGYKGKFAYIYLDKEEQQLHDELVRLGISKVFANMILISLIKAELGNDYLTHPALGYK